MKTNPSGSTPELRGPKAIGITAPETGPGWGLGFRSALFSTLCAATLLGGAFFASAQSFTIDRARVAGGGGTSTGGVFAVSGTIGQPDAGGAMTNGAYAVTGGFWAWPVAVQTSGAPTLSVLRAAPGLATISWTPATPGFVLQETVSLGPSNWVNSVSGPTNPVVVPAAWPTKYYRLIKP